MAAEAGWAAPRAVTPRMRALWAPSTCTAARLHRVSHSLRLPSSHPAARRVHHWFISLYLTLYFSNITIAAIIVIDIVTVIVVIVSIVLIGVIIMLILLLLLLSFLLVLLLLVY